MGNRFGQREVLMDNDAQSLHNPWPLRRRITVAVALLIASAYVVQPNAGGWEGFYSDIFKAGMRGPKNTFPSAIATEPPLRSMRLVGTSDDAPIIFRGVRLEEDISDVRAISIRTGETYWSYHRRGKRLMDLGVDRASGDIYITWVGRESGLLQAFDRIDIRTGKVHWRRDIRPVLATAGRGREEDQRVVGGIRSDSQTVVLLTSRLILGLTRDHGRQRWSIREPRSCATFRGHETVTVESGILVVSQTCIQNGKGYGYIMGISAATGIEQWRLDVSPPEHEDYPEKAFIGTRLQPHKRSQILYMGNNGPPGTLSIDVRSGRSRPMPVQLSPWNAVGDGVSVEQCSTKAPDRVDSWCAKSLQNGGRVWTTLWSEELDPELDMIPSHGRVYVLLSDRLRPGTSPKSDYVEILDLNTGASLGRLKVPQVKDADGYPLVGGKLVGIQDGVVIIDYARGPYLLLADPAGAM
jgi:hypothetical protein